jgi:lysophospholipase L1-like esterase
MNLTKLLMVAGVGVLMFAGVAYRMPSDPTAEGGQAVVATPPATVAAVGDSITAGYLAPVSWPMLVSQWDDATVTDLGHPGWATATMVEHFGDAIATGAQMIMIMGGTNDCAYGVPVSQAAANIASMVTAAEQAGRRPLLIGPLPREGNDSTGAPDNTCLLNLRAAESAYASANGVTFVDPWATFSVPNAFQTLYVDGTHPNADGAFLLATLVAQTVGWIS